LHRVDARPKRRRGGQPWPRVTSGASNDRGLDRVYVAMGRGAAIDVGAIPD
jgi:hypothetical protein